MAAVQKQRVRRVKGTGGVYQRESDGMWCASLELPSEAGKRRRKVIVRAKKADVLVELREAKKQLEKTGDLATSSPTLGQWCDLWWERYGMTRLAVSTRSTYQSKIDQYIKPPIGRVRLDRLTVEHVYRMHSYVTDTLNLTAASAMGAHRVLSSIISDAEREGRVTRNVVKVAQKPRVTKVKKQYLDGGQAAQLLAHARDDKATAAMWGVSILIGKRLGEVLGLTRDSIDLDAGTITVAWQIRRLPFEHGCGEKAGKAWPCGRVRGGNCPSRHLQVPGDQEVKQVSGGLYMTRPKARASWSVLPIVGHLHALLEAHLSSSKPGMEGLVFTRPDGRPHDPAAVNKQWHDLLDSAKLPSVDVHSLRHTCNTVLTELGVAVDVRKAILGQASSAVNEAVYTHTSDTRVADAMKALGESIKAE